ncbi:hypothetical protein SAMN05421833_13830 [Microbispora rosea]|uniref:DUF5134 domain-containing protein n=1 Tax=Microbispora rosea TaxID=58117 RepID=A0A1N7H6U0_9ACTN|nr:hypothetical protein Mro03_72450 [Microbispora rosea subsp. rosea]SIS20597.1 hypothetical protein SAMN05421833_13830 [Microbispora rosea]
MIESTPLRWTLILVLAGTGVWFVFRGVRPGSGGAVPGAERISHLAHALMAAMMAAMIWPMG